MAPINIYNRTEVIRYSAPWLFDSNLLPSALVTIDGKFIACNSEFTKIVEYSELELQKMRFQDITAPGDVEIDEANSEQVADKKIASYEMLKRYVTKSNKVIWVLIRVTGIFDEHGKFICFFSQIMPREISAPSIPSVTGHELAAVKLLAWLRKNWPMILYILTGLTALAGYLLKEIKGK